MIRSIKNRLLTGFMARLRFIMRTMAKAWVNWPKSSDSPLSLHGYTMTALTIALLATLPDTVGPDTAIVPGTKYLTYKAYREGIHKKAHLAYKYAGKLTILTFNRFNLLATHDGYLNRSATIRHILSSDAIHHYCAPYPPKVEGPRSITPSGQCGFVGLPTTMVGYAMCYVAWETKQRLDTTNAKHFRWYDFMFAYWIKVNSCWEALMSDPNNRSATYIKEDN